MLAHDVKCTSYYGLQSKTSSKTTILLDTCLTVPNTIVAETSRFKSQLY